MRNKNILPALIILVIIFILLFFHLRGLSIHDGGYIVNSAQKLLNGQKIYKDFDFVYTPGSVLLTALIFKIFGSSIFIERIFAFLISLVSSYFLISLLSYLTSNYFLITIIYFLFLSWGPTHINFLSPVMLSITTGIATIYFFVKYLKNKKANHLMLAGLTTGLTILWKQNFGIMMFLTGIIFFVTNRKLTNKKNISYFLIGFFLPLISLIVYLLLTNSLIPFFGNFWFYTIKNIILEQRLTTQFFYGSNILVKLLKAIFYTTPLWISILAGWNIWKNNKKYLFIPLWVIFYYLVSIRPETDFIHLAPVLSLTGITIVFFKFTFTIQSKLTSEVSKAYNLLVIFFTTFLIILGFWTSLFFGYYRWEKPLVTNTIWNNNPRVLIWTDISWFQFINELSRELNSMSKQNEYMYIHANAPLLYFITGRKNPTRFDFVVPYTDEKQYQDEIINDLKNKQVKVVLTGNTYNRDSSMVMRYIRAHYFERNSIDQFVLWSIRE